MPGLARVVGVDTGQLYSLARDAEGGVLGVQGLLIRAALRTWQAPPLASITSSPSVVEAPCTEVAMLGSWGV